MQMWCIFKVQHLISLRSERACRDLKPRIGMGIIRIYWIFIEQYHMDGRQWDQGKTSKYPNLIFKNPGIQISRHPDIPSLIHPYLVSQSTFFWPFPLQCYWDAVQLPTIQIFMYPNIRVSNYPKSRYPMSKSILT